MERITDDAKIQDEIDVYGALLPRPGELSATLMIEIADKEQIKPVLDRFMGIDTGQNVWIQVGKEFAVAGEFEAGHSDAGGGQARRRALRPLPLSRGGRSRLRRLARVPGGGSSRRAGPRGTVGGDEGRAVRGSAAGEGGRPRSVPGERPCSSRRAARMRSPRRRPARAALLPPRARCPCAGGSHQGPADLARAVRGLPQSRPGQGRADRSRRQGRVEGLARSACGSRGVPAGLQAQAGDQGDAPAARPRRQHSRPRRIPALNAPGPSE